MTKTNFNINEMATAEEAIVIVRQAVKKMPLFKNKAQKQVLETLRDISENYEKVQNVSVGKDKLNKLIVSQSIRAMEVYNLYC